MISPFPLTRSLPASPAGIAGALATIATKAGWPLAPAAQRSDLRSAEVAIAATWPDVIWGRPDRVLTRDKVGYTFWKDRRGLTLATTGHNARVPRLYVGTLETDGVFTDVDLWAPEYPEGYFIRDSDQRIRFSFRTYVGIDGMIFDVDGGSYLTLDLKLDNRKARADQIFLGKHAEHPPCNAFAIYR
jgi:hypothetical protein